MLGRFLGGKNGAENVRIELPVEFVLGDVFERLELIDAGIVHQNIDAAESRSRFLEQPEDVGRFGDVALDHHRLAATGLDVGNDAFSALAT